MKVPGTRATELVPVLRLKEGDLIALRAPDDHVVNEAKYGALQAQAEALAARTGHPVLFLAAGYDVVAYDPELLLETIAKYRNQRFIAVAEDAIPVGPPPSGKRVVVKDFSRAADGWGVNLALRSEPDVREFLRELRDGKLGADEARGLAGELLEEIDRQGG